MWFSPLRRAHSFQTFTRASRTQGGRFSECVSRLSAAQLRSNNLQELLGLRITRFRHVALALAPRTFDLKELHELHGLRAVPFQNVALAPRTFFHDMCKSFTDSSDQRTRN
eukprot:7813072-Pyramimonas_sp.AAC.1